MKEKISDDAKKELETEIEAAKKVLTSESLDELKAAHEKLQTASHKVAGEMYQQGAPGADAGAQGLDLTQEQVSNQSLIKKTTMLLTLILKKFN